MNKQEMLNKMMDLRDEIQNLKFANYQLIHSGCDMERRIELLEDVNVGVSE